MTAKEMMVRARELWPSGSIGLGASFWSHERRDGTRREEDHFTVTCFEAGDTTIAARGEGATPAQALADLASRLDGTTEGFDLGAAIDAAEYLAGEDR